MNKLFFPIWFLLLFSVKVQLLASQMARPFTLVLCSLSKILQCGCWQIILVYLEFCLGNLEGIKLFICRCGVGTDLQYLKQLDMFCFLERITCLYIYLPRVYIFRQWFSIGKCDFAHKGTLDMSGGIFGCHNL